MLAAAYRTALRHRDPLAGGRHAPATAGSRPQGRDMDLWRHLFAPDDVVRVGRICFAACEATAAECCWGRLRSKNRRCRNDASIRMGPRNVRQLWRRQIPLQTFNAWIQTPIKISMAIASLKRLQTQLAGQQQRAAVHRVQIRQLPEEVQR
jgi:hypothetical protein